MAGLGYKAFASGEVLTAANLQGYAVDQSTMVFASAAARTSALASPSQGMVSFLTDSGTVWQYYAIYNASTNPGGAKAAGWYLMPGSTPFYATATRSTSATVSYLMGDTGFAMTELRDTLGWHSAATNPTRVTPTVAGIYQFTANGNWAGSTAVKRIRAYINGTVRSGSHMGTPYSDSLSNSFSYQMNGTTDYYTVDFYNETGTVTILSQLSVTYLGPTSA